MNLIERFIILADNDKVGLSIIIPCYNESHRIIGTLKQVFTFLDQQSFTYEIRVMDDASTDNCVALMKKNFQRPNFHIHQFDKNYGKGHSIKKGIEESLGEYIMFMDADLAVPIEKTFDLLNALQEGNDFVVGIRIFDPYNSSRFRRIIGLTLLLYAHILLPLPQISDTQCGFKGFSRKAALSMAKNMLIKGGMFDIEMILIASVMGFKIKNIPVPWINRPGSTIRIFRCLIKDPFDILRIRINLWFNKYHHI